MILAFTTKPSRVGEACKQKWILQSRECCWCLATRSKRGKALLPWGQDFFLANPIWEPEWKAGSEGTASYSRPCHSSQGTWASLYRPGNQCPEVCIDQNHHQNPNLTKLAFPSPPCKSDIPQRSACKIPHWKSQKYLVQMIDVPWIQVPFEHAPRESRPHKS